MEHHVWPYWYVIFSGLAIVLLVGLAAAATRRRQRIPDWLQNAAEQVYESFEAMTVGIIGEKGRKYTPFIGTLFLYILVCNLLGLVPGMIAPTASLNTTLALAILVFLYVQYEGIRANGLIGYLKHFAGGGEVPLFMAPLMFVIELIGEFAKPFSLAVRLYGNMFGKEQVILALIGLVVPLLRTRVPIPVPLQFPILIFGVFVSVVQAFVFALLACIYLSLMTEHAHPEHAETAH